MSESREQIGDITETMKTEQGRIVVVRSQDVEPYLKANRQERNSHGSWRPYAKRAIKHVASIPNVIAEQWMREGLNIFDPSPETQRRIAQRLNSNEYEGLRTCPGRIGWKT